MPDLPLSISRSSLAHLGSLLDSFSAKRLTFDSHVQHYLDSRFHLSDARTREFISLVAPSVHRRLPLLHAFADSLLAFSPASTLREDRTLYALLAWALLGFSATDLIPARPENSPRANLARQFVLATPMEKWGAVASALDFALHHLRDWVVMEWAKILDIRFIEQQILGNLLRNHDDLQALLAEVRSKALLQGQADKASNALVARPIFTTKPEPFNLSSSAPSAAENVLVKEPEYPFKPQIPKRKIFSEKLPEKKAAPPTQGQMPQLHALLRTRPVAAPPQETPVSRKKHVNMKITDTPPVQPLVHTVTSVLRLHAQISRQQASEWQEIERYLTELRDSAEYDAWRATMEEADRLRDERRVEERKREAEVARIDAVEAQKRKFEQKRRDVQEEAERKERQRSQLEDERSRELEQMKTLVQEVRTDERVKPVEAVETVKRKNKREAEDLKKIKQEEEHRLKLEREKALALKKDIIARIRALEKVSIVRPTPFDPSEPPRHGLLEELSIAELRERLEIARLEHDREVERRRRNIQEQRASRWDDIQHKWAEIAQVRQQRRLSRRSDKVM